MDPTRTTLAPPAGAGGTQVLSSQPRRPRQLVLLVVPWVAALAVVALMLRFSFPPALPEAEQVTAWLDLESTAFPRTAFPRTANVELGWIEEAFPVSKVRYLPAPPGPPPCPDGLRTVGPRLRGAVQTALGSEPPDMDELGALQERNADSWLPPLALASSLLAGRAEVKRADLGEAETTLKAAFKARAVESLIDKAALAAKGRLGRKLPTEQVLAAIHLLQTSGYLRLKRNRIGDDHYWRDFKNPIGASRIVAALGKGGGVSDVSTWVKLDLPPPGCAGKSVGDGEWLTTFDLYTRDFEDDPARRNYEVARPYRDPPQENPLQAVLNRMVEQWDPALEYRVWAISNAERLLREQGVSLDNARLALNLAQLMQSAEPVAPAVALPALLLQESLSARSHLGSREKAAFNRGLSRLALIAGAHLGRPTALAQQALASLPAEQRRVADQAVAAQALRADSDTVLTLLTSGGTEGLEKLEKGARPWLVALRQDAAAGIVAGGSEEVDDLKARLLAARAVLAGVPAPDAVREAEKQLGLVWTLLRIFRSRLGVLLLSASVGAVVWLPLAWLTLILRRRRELMTSFYRLEVEHRLKEGG